MTFLAVHATQLFDCCTQAKLEALLFWRDDGLCTWSSVASNSTMQMALSDDEVSGYGWSWTVLSVT